MGNHFDRKYLELTIISYPLLSRFRILFLFNHTMLGRVTPNGDNEHNWIGKPEKCEPELIGELMKSRDSEV